jgi:hypothetical protein
LLSFFFLGLNCPGKNSPLPPRGYGEKLMGVDLRAACRQFLDNLRMLSVMLGIHGDLSLRQARRTLLRRAAASRPVK